MYAPLSLERHDDRDNALAGSHSTDHKSSKQVCSIRIFHPYYPSTYYKFYLRNGGPSVDLFEKHALLINSHSKESIDFSCFEQAYLSFHFTFSPHYRFHLSYRAGFKY